MVHAPIQIRWVSENIYQLSSVHAEEKDFIDSKGYHACTSSVGYYKATSTETNYAVNKEYPIHFLDVKQTQTIPKSVFIIDKSLAVANKAFSIDSDASLLHHVSRLFYGSK
ncbi:hypothetical protein RF11_14533 [Thelohanellus kitauei]|uniref:Uncharacterized protein n=1 Tax=Thelohanellus kitauei TaxID=669202 RepID=A0A0C2IP30_THEKT|nr:hypothetical protein RF11_14533 [Thelohanellus kitauei]